MSGDVEHKHHYKKYSVGDTLLNDRYEISQVVVGGGMSNVYKAIDKQIGKFWCIKEIRKSEAGKRNLRYDSLVRESQIMAKLNNPSIPRITTMEDDGDSLFIVMDWVDNSMTLERFIADKGPLQETTAVQLAIQIASVMMYLHRSHILYRDMKPSNVMVQTNGSIKIIDFGISVLVKTPGQLLKESLGTAGYAAPEMRKGQPCDYRSDIYSIGMTIYQMLTAINPNTLYKNNKARKLRGMETLPFKSINEVNPGISQGLSKIVTKCINPDPSKRFNDCAELISALQEYHLYDNKYIESAKRKIHLTIGMFITSLLLIITSLIPYNLYINKEDERYQNALIAAEQSGREEDYISALKINSSEIRPYLGYIESIKVDGVFSKDEESNFLQYLNPELEKLKKDKDYGELAYEIGKLYWFYYEGDSEEEGQLISNKWFKDAIDAKYEVDSATVYYQLGNFKKNITSAVMESDDKGMYKDYWNNLLKAQNENNGELVELQIYNAIINCINTYSYNLKEDGITYDEINSEVNKLETFVKTYKPSGRVQRVQELYDELKNSLGTIMENVNTVYGAANSSVSTTSEGGEN